MILVVGAIILDSLDAPTRLLAARRSSRSAAAAGWEFPGGKVEPGEEPLDALHRELDEELGVEVEVGHELRNPMDDVWPIDERYVMRTWFVKIRHGTPMPSSSHDEFRWLGADELFDVTWLAADLPIAELLRRRLPSARDAR